MIAHYDYIYCISFIHLVSLLVLWTENHTTGNDIKSRPLQNLLSVLTNLTVSSFEICLTETVKIIFILNTFAIILTGVWSTWRCYTERQTINRQKNLIFIQFDIDDGEFSAGSLTFFAVWWGKRWNTFALIERRWWCQKAQSHPTFSFRTNIFL